MIFPIEIFLVLHYQPLLPLFMGPIVLLLGTFLLGTTRVTNRLVQRWGSRYYLFSGIVRPLGIIIISWGWLEILAWDRNIIDFYGDWQALFIFGSVIPIFIFGVRRPILAVAYIVFLASLLLGKLSFAVYVFIFILSLLFAGWSIYHLGIRQSLLYRKAKDPLVTDGPYSILRHPQLFAALSMTFAGSWMRGSSWGMFNCVLFGLMLGIITWYEEKDLVESYSEDYKKYIKQVPGLIPTLKLMPGLISRKYKDQIRNKTANRGEGLSFVEFATAIAIIGILSAIAIPDFLKFQSKTMMNFAETDLEFIYEYQKKHHNLFGTYYDGKKRMLDLEFRRWERTRFTWFVGPGLNIPSRKDPVRYDQLVKALQQLNRMDLVPHGDKDSFISIIAENYDEDDCIEIWYINEKKEIRNLLNDLDMPCSPRRAFD